MRKLVIGILVIAGGVYGCKEVESDLYVLSRESGAHLWVLDENHRYYRLQPDTYEMTISFSGSEDEASELVLERKVDGSLEKIVVPTMLPHPDDFLHVNEPMKLSSNTLRQPFSMVVTREVDLEKDNIGITIYDEKFSELLATSEFQHESYKTSYDKNSMQFLQSYQKVRYSQRAAVIPIHGDLEMMIGGGRAVEALDSVINFAAQVFLAPWVYFRYSDVYWILGKRTEDREYYTARWKKALKDNPVVDYLAFTHGGVDKSVASPLKSLPKKEHQLRFVYTEGCWSGSAHHFLSEYNAAVAVGHYQTSASPLFAFSLVRKWVYGNSVAKAVHTAWESGKRRARALDALSFGHFAEWGGWSDVEDMIESSELMSSWTPELPPNKLYVGLSAVPRRRYAYQQEISEVMASSILEAEERSEYVAMLR